jgi:DNA-binding PadR family transcriptional regulator
MEEDGLVVSYEGAFSHDPKRRMYSLTNEGKQQLSLWVEDLKRSRDEIDHLLAIYTKQVNADR